MRFLSFVVVLSVLGAGEASAQGLVCDRVSPDLFAVDGMVDDWRNFRSSSYGQGQGSFKLHCGYDQQKLYLMFMVTDRELSKNDELRIRFKVGTGPGVNVRFTPAAGRSKRKVEGLRSGMSLEDSLQPEGYSVELSMELSRLPQYAPTIPYFKSWFTYHDSLSKKKVGRIAKLHPADAAATYRSFMKAAKLRNSMVVFDELADVDTGKGPERVVIGKTIMGILGTNFSYTPLPIQSGNDLLRTQLVDFDGSGRHAILTEIRQRGNGGSRDLVVVWFVGADGSAKPALIAEVAKQFGDNKLTSEWSLVPKGSRREGAKRGKGVDLVIEAKEAIGFNEGNYREAPASDAKQILTPWGEQTSAVYTFEGTQLLGGGPATPVKGRRK